MMTCGLLGLFGEQRPRHNTSLAADAFLTSLVCLLDFLLAIAQYVLLFDHVRPIPSSPLLIFADNFLPTSAVSCLTPLSLSLSSGWHSVLLPSFDTHTPYTTSRYHQRYLYNLFFNRACRCSLTQSNRRSNIAGAVRSTKYSSWFPHCGRLFQGKTRTIGDGPRGISIGSELESPGSRRWEEGNRPSGAVG